MGDRAVIVVKSEGDIAPAAVYLHWSGAKALDFIKKAVPRMRKGDVGYSAARLIGVCHRQIAGNLSLGVVDPPTMKQIQDKALDDYSPGDAGVIVYDCQHGGCDLYAGYLAEKHNGRYPMPVPPDN